MSTKIHHGWRIRLTDVPHGFAGLAELFEQTFEPIQRTLHCKTIAAVATANHDQQHHTGEPNNTDKAPQNWLRDAETQIDAAAKTIVTTGHRNVALDLELTLGIYTDPNDNEHAYLLAITEQEAHTLALSTIVGIEYYGYWNNTDRPDDVSEAEWDRRRTTWNRVLGTKTTHRPLRWTIGGVSDGSWSFGNRDEIAKWIPNVKTRARNIARDQILDTTTSTDPDEIRAAINTLATTIEPTLDELTIDDLTGQTG